MQSSNLSVGHSLMHIIYPELSYLLMLFPLAHYIALILITVLVILMSVYHKQIVEWLKPAAQWMHE